MRCPSSMDLLCTAYAAASDSDDAADDERFRRRDEDFLSFGPKTKRLRSDSYPLQVAPARFSAGEDGSPLPAGRYISKRERAAMLSVSASAPLPPLPLSSPEVATSPVVGSISDSDLPKYILKSLRSQARVLSQSNKSPGKLSFRLDGHNKAVNTIEWSQSHAHLLASAGMDQKVHIWNVWQKDQQKARTFEYHNAAVKDVRWSSKGLEVLSCGYDCSSRLVDVEKGVQTQLFKEDQTVEVIKFHPIDSNLFLSGGSKGSLRLWDLRVDKVVKDYLKDLGPILDIDFSADAKHFISSSDTSRSCISENSIVVWDVSRQVPLSNQVYTEAYTCPCIRYHPSHACFVAQSNGNYIAIFSARPPFKLDKFKRYEKHGVWGFPTKCNFSLDGKELASGSSDGCVYFYNYKSSVFLRKIKAFEQPCIDVAFHPVMPNVIASCSWNGQICVYE